jgi:hypothetical protein
MADTSNGLGGVDAGAMQGLSAAEIRFLSVFPEAHLDKTMTLERQIDTEYSSALARHNQSGGFVFTGHNNSESRVEPLDSTFEASLDASISLPSADE